MITISDINAVAKKYATVYETWMKPVCRKAGIPHTALCIFMFVANNPEKNTAQQICEARGYKRAIVSMHIESLVQKGLLKRTSVEGDRRKWALEPTEKAQPIITEARQLLAQFGEAVTLGFSEEDLKKIQECFNIFRNNLDSMGNKVF